MVNSRSISRKVHNKAKALALPCLCNTIFKFFANTIIKEKKLDTRIRKANIIFLLSSEVMTICVEN